MIKQFFCIAIIICAFSSCKEQRKTGEGKENTEPQQIHEDFITRFEKSDGMETATYHETIEFYETLADEYSSITIEEYGQTDAGLPLHLITYSTDGVDWTQLNKDKIKILINNGIHPGESDGVDASMILLRELANGAIEVPDNLVLSVIPIYNVGGAINRNSTSRTNQNGPKDYGFRGNARNYDLNRDFIKADTRNARAFYEIFHTVVPDIFMDNHVSNGADYQYTVTHLFTQPDKLDPSLSTLLRDEMIPAVEQGLKKRGVESIPYVNAWGDSPDTGYSMFYDHPRYSSGYTALWNTLGMMVETHMLKPYEDRVMGTKAAMESVIEFGVQNTKKIKDARRLAFNHSISTKYYPTEYALNQNRADTITFKGYPPVRKKSSVTDRKLLTYDSEKPTEYRIAFNQYYRPIDSVRVPSHYVIPQGWWEVTDLLRLNNVQMERIQEDTIMTLSVYRITDYETAKNAYEGHYPHSNIKVEENLEKVQLRKGDLLVKTAQPSIKYIIETLEPNTADSFLIWNFFDTVLQQKEHFSSYVFEKTAEMMLNDSIELKKEFDSIKRANDKFAQDGNAQLDWIHKRSKHYEKEHLRHPVFKIYK